jgi:hypothetical protein
MAACVREGSAASWVDSCVRFGILRGAFGHLGALVVYIFRQYFFWAPWLHFCAAVQAGWVPSCVQRCSCLCDLLVRASRTSLLYQCLPNHCPFPDTYSSPLLQPKENAAGELYTVVLRDPAIGTGGRDGHVRNETQHCSRRTERVT